MNQINSVFIHLAMVRRLRFRHHMQCLLFLWSLSFLAFLPDLVGFCFYFSFWIFCHLPILISCPLIDLRRSSVILELCFDCLLFPAELESAGFFFAWFFDAGGCLGLLNLAQCCASLAIIEVFDIFIYFFDKFFLVNRMKSFVFYIANCRNIFIDFVHNFSSDS